MPSPEYETLILWSPADNSPNGTLAVPLTTGTVVSTPSTLTVKLPVASAGKSIEIESSSPVVISSGISIAGATLKDFSADAESYLSSPE